MDLKYGHQNFSQMLEEAYKQGGFEKAITECHQAIVKCPNWGDAYGLLGEFLYASGRKEAAIRAYEQAMLVEPNRVEFRVKWQELGGGSKDSSRRQVHWIGDTPVTYFMGG